MASGPPGPTPWDRRASAVLILLVVGCLGSLWWLGSEHYHGRSDSSMYIITARALLAGEGYTYLGEPFTIRPPGFSLLLTPVLALFGTDFRALNLSVGLFGVATVALVFVHARPRLGSATAGAVAAAVWLNPGFQRLCNQVMSDVPGMAAMLGCLILETRVRRRGSPSGELVLGLAIGLATLVRSTNLMLVPAVLAARWVAARRLVPRSPALLGRSALLLAGALVVLVPWQVRDGRARSPEPADQTHIHSYSTAQWHTDPGDPASSRVPLDQLLGRVPRRLGEILPGLGSRLEIGRRGTLPTVLGLVALACSVAVGIRRREPTEWVVAALLAVLATYFAFKLRLVMPLFVLCLPAVAEVLLAAARRLVGVRGAPPMAMALVLALAVRDVQAPPNLEARREEHRARLELCRRLDDWVPPGVALAAPAGWELGVYLEDRRVYSLWFAWEREGLAGVLRLIEEHDIGACAFYLPQEGHRTLLSALEPYLRPRAHPSGDWILLRTRRDRQ